MGNIKKIETYLKIDDNIFKVSLFKSLVVLWNETKGLVMLLFFKPPNDLETKSTKGPKILVI